MDPERIKASVPRAGSALKKGFAWLWFILRLPVFLVMYWLSTPIILLCDLISTPMLFLWLFSLYAFPEHHTMVRAFGFVSFLAFVIAWTYDFVLMSIAPQNMMRTL